METQEQRQSFINQIASMISHQPLPPPPATGPDFVYHLEQRDVLPKELLDEARKLGAREIDARVVANVQAAAKTRQTSVTIGLPTNPFVVDSGQTVYFR